MGAIATRVSFAVMATSREEAIVLADRLQFDFQQTVGGEPWVCIDDDFKRLHAMQNTMSDDQGFYYEGTRTIIFNGPMRSQINFPLHDGFDTQKGLGDDD